MFRKRDDENQPHPIKLEDLESNFIKYEDIDFHISYHIAMWYPDTDLGRKVMNDSPFIKDEVKNKMIEASKLFDDPSLANLARREKISIYQSRIQ